MKNMRFKVEHLSLLVFSFFLASPSHSNQTSMTEIKIGTYDTNIYLVQDSEGKTKAKLALKPNPAKADNYFYTTAGITEKMNDFIDFFIPVSDPKKIHNDFSTLKLNISPSEKNSSNICSQLSFSFDQNKIKVSNGNINLDTATTCFYNISNSEGTNISSFRIILNHTFKHWCERSDVSSEAYKTARAIAKNCNVNDMKRLINIAGKGIKDLSPISGFIYLNTIWLNENNITNLPVGLFDKLFYIRWIVLAKNQIEKLPSALFSKNEKLEYLWVSDNKISKIEENIFSIKNNLNWLSLSNNMLANENIPRNFLSKLPHMASLELSGNHLEKIPEGIADFKDLYSLSLDNNKISKIPDDLFKLKGLIYLRLNDNMITDIPGWVFSSEWILANPKLNRLYLNNNQISEMPPEAFYNMNYLNGIDLEGNPLMTNTSIDLI